MKLDEILPILKAYRVCSGGINYLIVEEVFVYSDSNGTSLILERGDFRKKLYSQSEFIEDLSNEGFQDFDDGESPLKLYCCWYRFHMDFILLYEAGSKRGKILTKTEILGEALNSDSYKCPPRVLPRLPKVELKEEFKGTNIEIIKPISEKGPVKSVRTIDFGEGLIGKYNYYGD